MMGGWGKVRHIGIQEWCKSDKDDATLWSSFYKFNL